MELCSHCRHSVCLWRGLLRFSRQGRLLRLLCLLCVLCLAPLLRLLCLLRLVPLLRLLRHRRQRRLRLLLLVACRRLGGGSGKSAGHWRQRWRRLCRRRLWGESCSRRRRSSCVLGRPATACKMGIIPAMAASKPRHATRSRRGRRGSRRCSCSRGLG